MSSRKAARRKRGKTMTDQNPQDYRIDQALVAQPVVVETDQQQYVEQPVVQEQVSPVVDQTVNEVPRQEVHHPADRPAFTPDGPFRLGVPRHGFLIGKGEAVAYVNSKFGIGGDEFTEDTRNAVKQWQAENGRYVNGEISVEEYRSM